MSLLDYNILINLYWRVNKEPKLEKLYLSFINFVVNFRTHKKKFLMALKGNVNLNTNRKIKFKLNFQVQSSLPHSVRNKSTNTRPWFFYFKSILFYPFIINTKKVQTWHPKDFRTNMILVLFYAFCHSILTFRDKVERKVQRKLDIYYVRVFFLLNRKMFF